jgi:hypothetical protein
VTARSAFAERAYQIWLEEGQPHGRDQDHWDRAKREIDNDQGTVADAPIPGPYENLA